MELLCPHCLKKVTVSDDKAGQVLNCPLCQGVFAAPALPPVPTRTSAAVSSVPTPFPMQPLEAPSLPPMTSVAVGPPPGPIPAPPPPPRPPADYAHRFAFRLRPDVLVGIAPVCLFLILFLLSFFGWHAVLDQPDGLSLWALGFSQRGTGLFTAYVLLTFLTFFVAVACALFELRIIPAPVALAVLLPWKSGITLLLLALTFALFAYDYQQLLFAAVDLMALAEKVAFRLHLIALIAAGLEVWVQSRIARNLPLPRITLKL